MAILMVSFNEAVVEWGLLHPALKVPLAWMRYARQNKFALHSLIIIGLFCRFQHLCRLFVPQFAQLSQMHVCIGSGLRQSRYSNSMDFRF